MSRICLMALALVSTPFASGCQDAKKPVAASRVFQEGEQRAEGKPKLNAPAEEKVTRKVIQNAKIEITVDNVEQADRRIMQIVGEAKGYVVKTDESVSAGARWRATWIFRVPADRFEESIDSLRTLGEITRRNQDSNDVTDEFIDTEARVKHWKSEEETLLKLLKEKAQSTEDLLKFRSQITEIREKIERMEARLKTIRTLTEMATIELEIRSRDLESPADLTTRPTTSVGRTFKASCEAIVRVGHGILILGAGIAPWLPILLFVAMGIRLGLKRLRRSNAARTSPTPAVAEKSCA